MAALNPTMPPPINNNMKSFNKERFWWVSFSLAISTLFGVYIKSNNNYATSLEKKNAQKDVIIATNQTNCDTKLRNQGNYYEGVIRNKDSTILALKDDKYRSVLDILNVRKVNGRIKIEQ